MARRGLVWWWRRLRLRVGSWVLGGEWSGVVTRLWLIRDRAMAAVNADGRVVLARCAPLAEALYEPMPGAWRLEVSRVEQNETPESQSRSGSGEDTTKDIFAGWTIMAVWTNRSLGFGWKVFSGSDDRPNKVCRLGLWRFAVVFVPADVEQVLAAADQVIDGLQRQIHGLSVRQLFTTRPGAHVQ